jgi:GNAT superfamily N-acetyltransferase
MTDYTIATYTERPDLIDAAEAITPEAWPEFMLHDPVGDVLWGRLRHDFPDLQFMLLGDNDEIMAHGNSIPLVWDGDPDSLPDEGWRWALKNGFEALERGERHNAISAMSITIHPKHQGKGISGEAVKAMRGIAAQHGFTSLIAPVRPNQKPLYPLTPIEHYIGWTQADGAPFDAWLRVHRRLGAKILKPCTKSMVVTGTITEWEAWARMRFPETGPYVVPGALMPVEIDREADVGRYVEPNVWMKHGL